MQFVKLISNYFSQEKEENKKDVRISYERTTDKNSKQTKKKMKDEYKNNRKEWNRINDLQKQIIRISTNILMSHNCWELRI